MKSGLLAERGRGRPDDDLVSEVYPDVIEGHDVYDDDFYLDLEDDVQEEKIENDNTKYRINRPTHVSELEAEFIFGRDRKFEVNMKNVLPPLSTLTNMRILDTEHAKDLNERLLRTQNVSALTLRPISYFDANLKKQVDFKIEGTRQQFEVACSGWDIGAFEDDQWKNMFQTIKWEPCDGQYILYACNV